MRFGNLGYEPVPGHPDEATIPVSQRQPSREAARMVVEMLGDTPLDGKTLLDIGCGRGGALAFLAHRSGLGRVIGYDLCESSVANARRWGVGAAHLLAADAQRIPFAGASIDIVLNAESAFHYPRIDHFLLEVRRVLAPGGRCCWADLLHVEAVEPWRALLHATGFQLVDERDITTNVRAALANREDHAAELPPTEDGINLARFTRVGEFAAGLAAGRYCYLACRFEPTGIMSSPAEIDSARNRLSEASARMLDVLPAEGILTTRT